MQKSKIATIAFIFLFLIYGIVGSFILTAKINFQYTYIINPLFWIINSILLRIFLGRDIQNSKLKKQIQHYIIIAILVYIIIYMSSGLVVTFGKNPYSRSLTGVLLNLWSFGTVIITKEYIRYRLIGNVNEKDKILIATLLSIVYIFIDMQLEKFLFSNITVIFIVKQIAQNLLPLIIKNVLYSYTVMNSNYWTSILYELITKLYIWISPILPNLPWIMSSIIDITIPLILFFYIRYIKNKSSHFRNREEIEKADPRRIIPFIIVVIFAIWFALGIFPIKPVSIASGSMEKELFIGDIAIIQKCKAEDVITGDVIEYQMKGYTVIHRIIEKKQRNGQFYFITKGDNNNTKDKNEVAESQLIGKVIFKVKYLGYPAIWLKNMQKEDNLDIQVET